MNRKQQDLAWSVLPKEFKEEVKKLYREFTFTREGYYVELFGLHNLTSDAEGEEMLTVSSNSVRVYKENIDRYRPKAVSAYDKGFWIGQDAALQDLFGSKCLRNDTKDDTKDDTKEPKPAEPKFKVGDKVKIAKNGNVYNNSIGEIIDISSNGSAYILFCNGQAWFRLTDLEPYTEPKKESRNLSQETANCDKHFDNILKDNFRNERRLNIATQILSGIVASPKPCKHPVKRALELADALLAECEKRSSDEKD